MDAQDREMISRGAQATGMDPESFASLGSLSKLLIWVASSRDSSPTQVIDFLLRHVSLNVPEEKYKFFLKYLESTEDEEFETESVIAFDFGDTYMGIELRPLLVPQERDGTQFHYGAALTVSYRSASGSNRALTLSISEPELQSLAMSLQTAVQDLRRLRAGKGES
jgi:hypothetical protein